MFNYIRDYFKSQNKDTVDNFLDYMLLKKIPFVGSSFYMRIYSRIKFIS
jgi:hypothetical protein